MGLDLIEQKSLVINYSNTDDILKDVSTIIDSARNYAYQAIK